MPLDCRLALNYVTNGSDGEIWEVLLASGVFYPGIQSGVHDTNISKPCSHVQRFGKRQVIPMSMCANTLENQMSVAQRSLNMSMSQVLVDTQHVSSYCEPILGEG